MTQDTLDTLKTAVRDKTTWSLADYYNICYNFLTFVNSKNLTRIVSPFRQNSHYIFYQYGSDVNNRITRPLNTNLFIESPVVFKDIFEKVMILLAELKLRHEDIYKQASNQSFLLSKPIDKIVYTIQQSIGCIGDAFEDPNQTQKRIGQLFETLIKLFIQEVGLVCEPRTITIPIPNYPGYTMSYELDVVFSRNELILNSSTEHKYIHPSEIVGSVKTTSKDRIDKIFLDKYLLTKLLEREIPVVAIFLHDVQRVTAKKDLEHSGDRHFGIASTFKTNHFLGYTVALNRLDGVYYVDPRPDMLVNERLREQISDSQSFLTKDLWVFSR